MNKGQHINMARVKAENHDLRSSAHYATNAKSNHEVSLLKLRISILEEDVKQRDEEIDRLMKKRK